MNPANYSSISFPFLGLEVNPPRIFSLGPLTLHLYGVVIALGLLLAGVYCCRRSRRAGLTSDDILDGILWITPFAVLCARAYYCVFSWQEYADNPISVLYIWNGGLAIYGAVIGAFLGVAVYCRIKKCRLTALLDLVVMGFLIGQSVGRWGNFFNREALARQRTASSAWAFSTRLRTSGNTTTPPSCMKVYGTRRAFFCCISCIRSAATTARSPWATPPGTAWAGPSSRACG